jgi:hypothetical protein
VLCLVELTAHRHAAITMAADYGVTIIIVKMQAKENMGLFFTLNFQP